MESLITPKNTKDSDFKLFLFIASDWEKRKIRIFEFSERTQNRNFRPLQTHS